MGALTQTLKIKIKKEKNLKLSWMGVGFYPSLGFNPAKNDKNYLRTITERLFENYFWYEIHRQLTNLYVYFCNINS